MLAVLGAILGLLAAGYTAKTQDLGDLLNDLSLDSLSDFVDDFKDMLPGSVLKEAQKIEKSQSGQYLSSNSFAVGNIMKKTNHTSKHPVIMVPGVISTGLESWSLEGTPECPSQPYFRKRLWGSFYMLRAMLLDKMCWIKHLSLDPDTGLDPPGFKMRAAQGMEAADFFIAGYWIWNKILENLAAIGYDLNTMAVAAYDWRLAYKDLEKRDGYFTKLKLTVEENLHMTGEKTVLTSHSMGSQVVFYFLKWVEADGYGNGGKGWVNKHIEAFIDISGSSLGTPKAIVALLSGEMKDTVQLNAMAVYGLEKFFSRKERAQLLRNFPGIASMLPKGGQDIWGHSDSAPDDEASLDGVSYGNFIRFRKPKSSLSDKNLTMSDSIDYLLDQAGPKFKKIVDESYSFGLAKTRAEVEPNEFDQRTWSNPLEAALPNAPDMKIYCFYGVGKPTERGYYYEEVENFTETGLNVSIESGDPNAVVMGSGDGTISLLTHSMCYRWRDQGSKFNPGNIPVKIVEMAHEPDKFDIRGGANTAEHVDILGRAELNELVLKVASGKGDAIKEKIWSPLESWTEGMDLGEN